MQETEICRDTRLLINKIDVLSAKELSELCKAAKQTIVDNASFSLGFHYLDTPEEEVLKRYFLGALLVPEREQFICKIDGVVAGYLELLKPSSNHLTKSFSAEIINHFVAPWARGKGIAQSMLQFAEQLIARSNVCVIKLSVRDNLKEAIKLYEKCGYKKWGSCDKYEKISQQYIIGHFYYKELADV